MSALDFTLGFIAGEAHLGVTKNYQWKPYVQPRLSIQVHERDEEILHEIRSVFDGAGKIKHRNDRNHVTWVVKSKEDLREVNEKIKSSESSLWKETDKYDNFKIWSEIVDIHCVDRPTTTEERIEIAKLAKGLNKDAGHNNVDWQEFINRLHEYEEENS